MSQADLLKLIADLLDGIGVSWMLVGSHASSYYGEARSTHDVDIVVDLPPEKIHELLDAVPSDRYYLSEVALREGRMANLIDTQSGDKVDLFMVGHDPIKKAELSRRKQVVLMNMPVYIASAEDTIVAKLRWHLQSGGSERQLRDVKGILACQSQIIDTDNIKQRLATQELEQLWISEIAPWLTEQENES